jgi:hypothetical protein
MRTGEPVLAATFEQGLTSHHKKEHHDQLDQQSVIREGSQERVHVSTSH